MSEFVYTDADYVQVLRDNGLSRFGDFMRCSGSPLVARHEDRETLLLNLADRRGPRRMFLKRARRVPAKQILEDLLHLRRPLAKPVREWQAIRLCQDSDIGVMRAVACGQRSRWGLPQQGFLLVEAVPASSNLGELLQLWMNDRPPPGRLRWRLPYELGQFVGRLHRAHLAWPDLMAKHIYLRPRLAHDGQQQWEFFLIDLERLSDAAARHRQTQDLKMLLRTVLPMRPGRTDLLRFALGYVSARFSDRAARRQHLRRRFGWATQWFCSADSGRSQRPSTAVGLHAEQFARIGRLTVNTRFVPLLQENGLGSFRAVFQYRGGCRLDKPGLTWRDRVQLELRSPEGLAESFFLKRYERPPVIAQIRRMLFRRAGHSTAWWEWHQIKQLRRAGLATPVPVAFGEKMNGWLEKRSFVLLAAADGESLEHWVQDALQSDGPIMDASDRRALVRQVADLVRALHRAGFCHRDLYLSHIFIDWPDGEPARLTLIDLQRVFRPRIRRTRWQIKDLAALYYSTPQGALARTDYLRFARSYLGLRRLDRQSKDLIRRVVRKARRMARHSRHRGT